MLYQRCSPAPGFRVLLALESALIIKTWKGASEAASISAEGRPSSPPLAMPSCLLCRGNKLPGWLQKHLLLGKALDSSDLATTSQGRLGSQAPQQIQA